jgi:hypothetical protein
MHRLVESSVWETQRKRPHEGPSHKWNDIDKMNAKEIKWEGVVWINLPEDGK